MPAEEPVAAPHARPRGPQADSRQHHGQHDGENQRRAVHEEQHEAKADDLEREQRAAREKRGGENAAAACRRFPDETDPEKSCWAVMRQAITRR